MKQPIEKITFENPKWAVLYLVDWFTNEDGSMKGPWPDVHGIYDNEEDANAFIQWATKPGELPRYWVKKVYWRIPLAPK